MDDGDVDAADYLDYGCPFSYLAQRWLDGAAVGFEPRGFSLAEAHRGPGGRRSGRRRPTGSIRR